MVLENKLKTTALLPAFVCACPTAAVEYTGKPTDYAGGLAGRLL